MDNATNPHLERVLKKAYRHVTGDLTVGTSEVTNDLCDALCNLIGPDAFVEWCDNDLPKAHPANSHM